MIIYYINHNKLFFTRWYTVVYFSLLVCEIVDWFRVYSSSVTHPVRFSCTVMTHLCSISMRLINMPNLEANRGVTYSGSVIVFLEQCVCGLLCQQSLPSGFAEHVLGGVVCAGAISLRLWAPQVLRGSSVILGIQRCVDASAYSVCVIREANRGVMYNIISLGKWIDWKAMHSTGMLNEICIN